MEKNSSVYRIGWFSTGRDEAARDLLAAAVDAIKSGEVKANIEFVFCSREPGESPESDAFIDQAQSYGLPLVCYSFQRFKAKTSAQDGISAHAGEARRNVSAIYGFNPKYTFDNFVVGASNRMAHAAAVRAAEHPSEQSYNPLFIYAAPGLGKTHLLQAIGQKALDNNLKPVYVSGEQFTNDFVAALRERHTDEFRAKYRSADMLMVDDIHFISGKEATEESFFHTFNDLHNAGRQIVVTSDRPPKSMPLLQERLRSRFEWGLTVDIQPPDFETRLAILQSKAAQAQTAVDSDVLDMMAHELKQNIRELEGSLNRIIAYARLLRAQITPELAAKALKDSPGWRFTYDHDVMDRLKDFTPDLCVLAGYMLIVGPEMCTRYTMINLHPALPTGPTGTWQEVIWRLMEQGAAETGVMMHLVTPELDRGPVVGYCRFPIQGDGFDALWQQIHDRDISTIKKTEGERNALFRLIREEGLKREFPLVIATIKAFSESRVRVASGKVLDARGKIIQGYDLTHEIDRLVVQA